MSSNTQKATVAAGCFWGVEHLYRKHFGNGKGLLDAKCGYTGGSTEDPNYKLVCSGTTGHAEAIQITFDPSIVTYRQLIEFFYRMHDPTTADRQGPDVGGQYRSAIFYHDEEQERIAREVTDKVAKQWFKDQAVTTRIEPAGKFWEAEEYHQLYLTKNPSGYECPSHFLRNYPPLE
ncbi:hypothetical protein VTN49DRAFT_1982 [Thermomyces lanuginosus]|uniref:uncharacterized protein n=1 Tax=Thermomyces lanuginosus TaxID=5541 RepID=UPI003742E9A2